MKKIFSIFSFFFLFCSPLFAIKNSAMFSMTPQEPKIFMNNRILAKVNGKPISTFDIMKKMDVSFYRQFPEYASSVSARHEYYQMAWKPVLEEVIHKELILADAKESKIEVTSGDVRQEMEVLFGPNIIANLAKIEMSFPEAYKIVEEDLIIQRVLGGRVHAKALRAVTPIKVRKEYEKYINDPANQGSTQWVYRVVTIQDRNMQQTEQTAKNIYQLLMEGVSLDQLVSTLQEKKILNRRNKVTVSRAITTNEPDLSPHYREMILGLDQGMYSQPFAHKNRTNKQVVYRIVLIQEKNIAKIPTFKELEGKLKEMLLDEAAEQETECYLQKLRQHYHFHQNDLEVFLPTDYKPFLLKE